MLLESGNAGDNALSLSMLFKGYHWASKQYTVAATIRSTNKLYLVAAYTLTIMCPNNVRRLS